MANENSSKVWSPADIEAGEEETEEAEDRSSFVLSPSQAAPSRVETAPRPGSYKGGPKGINPRQRRYLLLTFSGMTKNAAYCEAYGLDPSNYDSATIGTKVKILEDRPMVAAELRRMQERQEGAVLHQTLDGAAKVRRELWAFYEAAKTDTAKLRALELLGKAHGVFVERRENLNVTGSASELRALLERKLDAMLEHGDAPTALPAPKDN